MRPREVIRPDRHRRLPDRFAAALREARLAAGLSQRQLATRIGLHQPFISHLETGRRSPSRATVERLGRELRLPEPIRKALIRHARPRRKVGRLLSRAAGAPFRALELAELRRRARAARQQGHRRRRGGRPLRRARLGRLPRRVRR